MIKDCKAITVPELVENEDRRAAFRIPFVMGICKELCNTEMTIFGEKREKKFGEGNGSYQPLLAQNVVAFIKNTKLKAPISSSVNSRNT